MAACRAVLLTGRLTASSRKVHKPERPRRVSASAHAAARVACCSCWTRFLSTISSARQRFVEHPACCAGEYGELLFDRSARQLLPGETVGPHPDTPQDLLRLLDKLLSRPFLPHAAVEYGLTALVKLSARFADQSALIRVSSPGLSVLAADCDSKWLRSEA